MKNTIVFALSSSVGLAKDICKELGLELGKCEVKHFADGEILVELEESVRGKHVYFVQSTNKPVNSNLMEILIGIDACKRASAASITAIIPYFGYARQDRKAKPRQPITSKLVASLLERAGADRVVTVDLHATQIQGFFDKRRPKPNVAEAMNLIGDVDGKTAIIIDDMVDTAGTLTAGIKMLKDKGAKAVYASCSHGILSGPAIERLKAAELAGFVCTNTIDQTENQKNYPEMTVLSMAPLLAGLIHAVEENSSLSEVLAHAFDD